jgi:tRNA G18 (ribose-2'-O)-methylase SpoU
VPYFEANYPERVCLVVGNEDHGVTRAALALCDMAVFVPMYGVGRSLNVHVAAAIVLYHILHTPGH